MCASDWSAVSSIYNIYCDESCHIEHDGVQGMYVGALVCPRDRSYEISSRIRDIKEAHGIARHIESKWTKVSKHKIDMWLELVDLFLDSPDLHYRVVVVPDKAELDHDRYTGSHDLFHYAIAHQLFRRLIQKPDIFDIYMDVKDTRSGRRARVLHARLCEEFRDLECQRIRRLEIVRSEQVELVQLADLLTGAVAYRNRGLSGNAAKVAIIERLEGRLGVSLAEGTPLRYRKFNVFRWRAR